MVLQRFVLVEEVVELILDLQVLGLLVLAEAVRVGSAQAVQEQLLLVLPTLVVAAVVVALLLVVLVAQVSSSLLTPRHKYLKNHNG